MIRNIDDFTNIELYDEMVRNGELKQSEEELGVIIDDYNKNVGLLKKKSKKMLLKAYNMNWSMSEKRLKKTGQITSNSDTLFKLEEKFGIPFHNRTWFQCTIEEMRFSTFSNSNNRDVQNAYVFVESNFIEIVKESVFLKSKMGTRKIFFENIASIDFDARGKLHLTNSLIINLKSSEHIQLKSVPDEYVNLITEKFEQYMCRGTEVVVESVQSKGSVDDLMKYAELLEKGLITQDEFNIKKAEIMGTPTISENTVSAKFCSNCGNSLELDNKFCPNCGTRV